tara:strand:- start:1329 stop:4094 length:2766 start_codon:yes stop_codon:yes gene_type:complete
MGLLIKLNNGDTSFKSLKFGKDRPGGGDSGQPYIKKPISNQPLSALDGDGLLRGGLRAPLRALDDTARLSKYFFDFKNPSGLLFTAKQNLLSRISTKTEVASTSPDDFGGGSAYSPNIAYGKGTINEGIYTPASTILQAAGNFIGGHLNKQGIDPTGIKENLSITPYSKVASILNKPENNSAKTNSKGNIEYTGENSFSNRLLNFWSTKQLNQFELFPELLYKYSGGAGSTLGIGETGIKFATMPDGVTPLRTGINSSFYKDERTRGEYLSGKILPSNKTYINYVDGVPIFEDSLDYSKFVPISIYGTDNASLIVSNEFPSDPSNLKGIGFNTYQSLYNRVKNMGKMSMDYSIKIPGRHHQKEKNQFPIKASTAYNIAIKPLVESTIEGFKIDYEKIKKEKIKALKTRIQNAEASKNTPLLGKKIKLKNFTPSQSYMSALNNSSGISRSFLQSGYNSLTNIQVTEFEEYNEIEKAAAVARININIDKLKKEIADLEAAQFDPDNIDGPLQILSSGLGDSRKGLTRGDANFYFGDENRSVYKRGEDNKPTLIPRRDYINNLTPTLNEILSKRNIVYTANTTDDRFPKIVLENRVHAGDPGATQGSRTKALDKINAKAPYTGKTGKGDYQYRKNANDFAHFRIGVLDPFIPQNAAYMNFRALIEDVSDDYTAEWSGQKYMGRAEKLYKYNGFDRKMSLSFKVVVMSQAEMPAIYSKLNYLASSLAPAYSANGYMAGNIALLTLGEYVYEQYGIITSLSYKIPPESSWELIIGEGKGLDELPFMIDVSMNFTPIHDFRPEVGNHNRYITHNMRLPYSGVPLKTTRDKETLTEPVPPPTTTVVDTSEDVIDVDALRKKVQALGTSQYNPNEIKMDPIIQDSMTAANVGTQFSQDYYSRQAKDVQKSFANPTYTYNTDLSDMSFMD